MQLPLPKRRAYQLFWIGNVKPGPPPLYVPRVEVLFYPLIGYRYDIEGGRVDRSNPLVLELSINMIRSLKLDRVWRYGESYDTIATFPNQVNLRLQIRPSSLRLIWADELDERGAPYLPVAQLLPPSMRKSRLIMIERTTGHLTRYFIPCTEILRAFYLPRAAFLDELFSGTYLADSPYQLERGIVFDGTTFSRVASSRDAPICVTFNRYARACAQLICKKAIRWNLAVGVAAVEAIPPILGDVSFSFRAREFSNATSRVILVREITDVWSHSSAINDEDATGRQLDADVVERGMVQPTTPQRKRTELDILAEKYRRIGQRARFRGLDSKSSRFSDDESCDDPASRLRFDR